MVIALYLTFTLKVNSGCTPLLHIYMKDFLSVVIYAQTGLLPELQYRIDLP